MRRLLLLVMTGALLVACGGPAALGPLPKPKKVQGIDATPTTAAEDLAAVNLPRARGATTTSVAIGPGTMRIDGTVTGPAGPVGDAVVHLERLVGDAFASVDVPTDAQGNWNVEHVIGGRWRIRAYRAPSLAQVGATVLFLAGTHPEPVRLEVEEFQGVFVERALAPDPPVVGQQLALTVRLVSKLVDAGGTVRSTAVSGATVQLSGSSTNWSATGPVVATTDGNGDAAFRLLCRSEGQHPLLAVTDTGSHELALPACVLPAPETTTTTSVPGSGGSTTTSRPGTTSTVPRPTASISSTTSTTRPR